MPLVKAEEILPLVRMVATSSSCEPVLASIAIVDTVVKGYEKAHSIEVTKVPKIDSFMAALVSLLDVHH